MYKRKKLKNLIVGRKPICDALEEGISIEKIFIQKGIQKEFLDELLPLASKQGVPTQLVPKAKLMRLTGANHQGVIALNAVIEYQPFEEIVSRKFDRGENPLIMMLDGITDVRNFGAIARSAEVLGVDVIIIPQKGSAIIDENSNKAAAGALSKIPISRVKSLNMTAKYLQSSGVRLVTAILGAKNDINSVDMNEPICVIIGSEDKGVHPSLISISDLEVSIPQIGKTDSLNASVAAGIILYEIQRQRGSK